MENRVKFGSREAIALLTISSMARIFLSMPGALTEIAGQASWLSAISGFILALFQVYLFYMILKPHPGENLTTITMSAMGKIFGTIFNLIFISFFVLVAAIYARTFAETLIISALSRTPISVIITAFLLVSLLGAYVGLEGLSRSSSLMYPFVIISMLVLLVSLAPLWDVSNLFPPLGQGPYQVFFKGSIITGALSEIMLSAVIVQSFKGTNPYKKIALGMVLRSFAWLTFFQLVLMLTLNWETAKELVIPFFNLSNLVHLGRYFQRIEALLIILWGYIGLIKVSLALYGLISIFSDTFKLKDKKPVIWPFALIIFTVSLLPPDLPTTLKIESTYLRYWAWFPGVGLPLIVLITDRFRNRRSNNEIG